MILIGGGSGFIGRKLVNRLRSVGQRVLVISRNGGPEQITWDEVERAGIPNGVTAVVNLSGRNILEVRLMSLCVLLCLFSSLTCVR